MDWNRISRKKRAKNKTDQAYNYSSPGVYMIVMQHYEENAF
jgi:hypothetical protein